MKQMIQQMEEWFKDNLGAASERVRNGEGTPDDYQTIVKFAEWRIAFMHPVDPTKAWNNPKQ